ncbi:MAG TPA: hypothetical protein VGJ07_08670 [Rugosimonospora sp.]|jgi:hypothetical protein
MHITRRQFGVATALALSGLAAAPARVGWASDDTQPVADLGEPVHKTQDTGSALGPGPDGQPQAYFFVSGNTTSTGEFAVVDLRSQRTILDIRVPSGSGIARAMAVSPVDGTVYFGTSDTGDLYNYRPGDSQVTSLGVPVPGQVFWGLSIGSDGLVWGGTYPGGLVFSYDPATGQVHNYGQAIAGETYIEALEQVGGRIYVGSSPNAKLASLDPATGTFTQIDLPADHASTDIYKLNLRGTLLFVSTDRTYILDTTTGTWGDQLPGTGRGVSPVDPATGNTIYYKTSAGPVATYNLDTHAVQTLSWAPNAAPESWGWIDLADPNLPGPSVAFTYYTNGRTYAYNPATAHTYYLQPTLMGSGDQLTVIGSGPDGNIYCGAYLTPPGMGRWDPDKKAFELLADSGQVEGYGSFHGDLVYGRYPQGALYRYDLDKPWQQGTNPAPPVTIGNEQNRPQSFVDIGDQLAVSSVPETGRHGGAITLWNPDTNAFSVYRNVVTNQTPVSLVYRDGLIYGGTSINGGYGIDPITPEANLFVWDPVSHQTLFTAAPVSGATTVAGLAFDADGLLWGLAGSTLFVFNPANRKVIHKVTLFDDTDGSRYGNDHVLLFESGQLYGVTANRLFRYDHGNDKVTVLYDGVATKLGARCLATDRYGALYFNAASSHLYRYTPSEQEG